MTPEQVETLLTASDIVTVILSVVALSVTVIGFFASLKFYRDGVQLQKSANETLAKISEKTIAIETQFGGMFDKTLDAALARNQVTSGFDQMKHQVEIIQETVENQIDRLSRAGHTEKSKLIQELQKEFEKLNQLLKETRGSTEEISESRAKLGDNLSAAPSLLSFLMVRGGWISIEEIKAKYEMQEVAFLKMLGLLKTLESFGLVERKQTGETTYYRIRRMWLPDKNK